MSVTILETLHNAKYNISNMKLLGRGLIPLVENQLHNATTLLEKGYSIYDHVEPLLEKYGSIGEVPNKE